MARELKAKRPKRWCVQEGKNIGKPWHAKQIMTMLGRFINGEDSGRKKGSEMPSNEVGIFIGFGVAGAMMVSSCMHKVFVRFGKGLARRMRKQSTK